MFKGLKINLGSSKNDCCSITIQEIHESTETDKDCCTVNVESQESCCNKSDK